MSSFKSSRDIQKKEDGPKYRFPSQIDFNRCMEEIASALNDFGNRWCKRESVECNTMKEWIIIKSLDPLRAKKTFIRKKLGHTAVSAIKAS